MTSIGETLRRQRQKRNLELSKIAGDLKISARFLEAIEADDFGKLPGGVFTKSFVRQYAAYLGLDSEELASEVQRVVEPQPEISPAPDKSKPSVPGMQLEFNDNWQSVGEHRTSWPSWLTAGGLLIVLMLVCSGVYWWWERPRPQVSARENPPPTKVVLAPAPAPATLPPAATPVTDPPVAPSTTTAATETPSAPVIPVSASNPNATVRVNIVAVEAVWVEARINGKYQYSGVMQPHESRHVDGDGEVTVRLGNAGGVTLVWNGKAVGSVGPKGQIRTVQFTSGGFQIVPPAKSLDPLERL